MDSLLFYKARQNSSPKDAILLGLHCRLYSLSSWIRGQFVSPKGSERVWPTPDPSYTVASILYNCVTV